MIHIKIKMSKTKNIQIYACIGGVRNKDIMIQPKEY
jgi:hypothetical protein